MSDDRLRELQEAMKRGRAWTGEHLDEPQRVLPNLFRVLELEITNAEHQDIVTMLLEIAQEFATAAAAYEEEDDKIHAYTTSLYMLGIATGRAIGGFREIAGP